MKDLIRSELAKQSNNHLKRLALAEVLQHLILQSAYRQGAFSHITFTGGTALRILYHTNRYSEVLDFSLTKHEGFDFSAFTRGAQHDLDLQHLPCETKIKQQKTVAQATFKFEGLLSEFDRSPMASHKLTVKLEVDTNPPKGGKQEIVLVNSPISYSVTAFDLPSLFAGKLSAVFYRKYIKGRDYYDLAWFLGRRVKPDFDLLNNAIAQTQGEGYSISQRDFVKKLSDHLDKVDFKTIRNELTRFVINPEELKLLGEQEIKSLLRNY